MGSLVVSSPAQIKLSAAQRQRMQELLQISESQQKNKCRRTWSLATSCFVCKRAKHSCAWALRFDSTPVGSFCYSCIQAAKKLDCTNNQAVLTQMPDLIELLVKKSQQLAAETMRYSGDRCQCRDCSGACTGRSHKRKAAAAEAREAKFRIVPVVRLRQKTSPA